MKLNRKWILVIALVMSMAMATGGTLAYLTGYDIEQNTFTVGSVIIDLTEPHYPGDNQTLLPGVTIDKDPQIENIGNTDAWVWMKITMPTALYDMDVIKWDDTSYWTKEVNRGTESTVVTMKREQPLPAEGNNDTTAPAFTKIVLPPTLDNDDIKAIGTGSINIDVVAYAIQSDAASSIDKAIAVYDTNGEGGGEGGEGDTEPESTARVSNYEQLVEAIQKGGNIVLTSDITVDKWVMFSEDYVAGNGGINHIDKIDVTIDGKGNTLTVNSIESRGNGDKLFQSASNLNISNLTIKYADSVKAGGIGLDSGVISKVNFVGGGTAVFPGNDNITVENCTFTVNGHGIYFEEARDNLTVTGCTFNLPDTANVILLRGNVEFKGNTVNSGRTVNIVSGSPVVTGNNFNNVRLKVYSAATATISNNTINNLEFETTTYSSNFADDNTLSTEAQAALDAVTKN